MSKNAKSIDSQPLRSIATRCVSKGGLRLRSSPSFETAASRPPQDEAVRDADPSIHGREQFFDRILPRHHLLVERELCDRLQGLAVLLDAERVRIADHRGVDGCRLVPRG